MKDFFMIFATIMIAMGLAKIIYALVAYLRNRKENR